MKPVSVEEVVKDLRDLPALPSLVLELIHTFGQKDVDIATLADKISSDQALAARTLRLANSSFYGMSAKVKTVNQAIVVLGFDSVRTLVAAGGVVDHFRSSGDGVDTTFFWRHAIATALCARSLAREAKLNQGNAFIAGLLHDIGELVLATRFHDQYTEVLALRGNRDTETVKAEQSVFGVDHQRVGLLLAQSWKFPAMIQRVISQHHAPQREDLGDLTALVHVAEAIVPALDLSEGVHALVPQIQADAWDSLPLTPAQWRAVFHDTEMQYEEACQILIS